ncbi:MAG: S1 family peptidase [Pseudomonadales bacterium]
MHFVVLTLQRYSQAAARISSGRSLHLSLVVLLSLVTCNAATAGINGNDSNPHRVLQTQGIAAKTGERSQLEQRTRVIVTHSRRSDGSVQENRGSGVVVGHFFLTAHHNLRPGPRGRFRGHASFLAEIPVQPEYIDPQADIAIIRIPPSLCASWCEASDDLPESDSDLEDTVRWYRDPASTTEVDPGWRQARVLSRTWSLPHRQTVGSLSSDCDAGLVLEVDQPFLPGSSGAGVWDSNNRLVGIAQGSYQTQDGNQTGYFKPLRCIRDHWPQDP